jgi:hypothetical protein
MKMQIVDVTKAGLGWPLFSTWNALAYANTHQGWRAKVAAFLTFVPVLFITGLIWAGSWATVFWLLQLAISIAGAFAQ